MSQAKGGILSETEGRIGELACARTALYMRRGRLLNAEADDGTSESTQPQSHQGGELMIDKNYKLTVVKVGGDANWAIKAIMNGEVRYRGYYYKKEAMAGLPYWESSINMTRDFQHNFYTAEELNIREV